MPLVDRPRPSRTKKNAAEKLELKTDSYVVETNVHFPTDLNLLWDAAHKSIELLDALGATGWRKAKDWKKKLKNLLRRAAKSSTGGGKDKDQRTRQIVGAYLAKARELDAKVTASLEELQARALDPLDLARLEQVRHFHQHLCHPSSF